MKNTFIPDKGIHIRQATRECQKQIRQGYGSYMKMVFNELEIIVHADSNEDDIATIYDLKHKLRSVNSL